MPHLTRALSYRMMCVPFRASCAQGCPIAKHVKCATGVLVEFREGLAADTVSQVYISPPRCFLVVDGRGTETQAVSKNRKIRFA
jgi:hypothetical protein